MDCFSKITPDTVDGVIKLTVAKCEYAIRRISYNYEEKVTHRWGKNTKQGILK